MAGLPFAGASVASSSSRPAPAPPTLSTNPRAAPVKRYDGEPLTRADICHCLISHIFEDTTRCFTNPRPGVPSATDSVPCPVYPQGRAPTCAPRSDLSPEELAQWQQRCRRYDPESPAAVRDPDPPQPGAPLLTFKELYIEALINSQRMTKTMREKILADEEYAEDYAKVCLLVNVGKMNTTLAFYPEMKTVLRSYHSVPCIQRNSNTRRHMQDAPRMKSLLKQCLLDHERAAFNPSNPGRTKVAKKGSSPAPRAEVDESLAITPLTLEELRERHLASQEPPTTIVTVLFLLSACGDELSSLHFTPPLDAYSIFFPDPQHPVASRQRARCFLWLVWRYYEGQFAFPPGHAGTGRHNPFADQQTIESEVIARNAWNEMSDAQREATTLWKGIPAPDSNSKESGSDNVPTAELNSSRILAPRLDVTTDQALEKEDVDKKEELEWGHEMQQERTLFLQRFQAAEQERVASVTGGDGASLTEGDTRKMPLKRMPGGNSSYPLANILAAANATDSSSKRLRTDATLSPGVGASDVPPSSMPDFSTLDLRLPSQADEDELMEGLPMQAWRRILDRAARGVGDASYDSDDEAVAEQEAEDERPREELARMLLCLRAVQDNAAH